MKITKEWLKSKSACRDGYEWALKVLNDKPMNRLKFLGALIKDDKLAWANWVIVRTMTRTQYLQYAIFAAEEVIYIYNTKYPGNDKPRKAIEAAKAVLKNATQENRTAAAAAYAAAYAGAVAAYAADAAADAAAYAAAVAAYAYAADAAAYAADAAAYAADAAAYAADAAAYAAADAAAYAGAVAAYAADAARKEMRIRILNYGISLLKDGA